MTVNNIGKSFSEGMIREAYPFKNKSSRKFEESLLPENRAEKPKESRREEQIAGRNRAVGYQGNIGQCLEEIAAASTEILARCSREEPEAVRECEVRHITFADSDFSKVYVTEGFSLKAKADLEEGKIYLEQKFEDGTVKAYEADAQKLKEKNGDILGQTAARVWAQAKEVQQEQTVDFHKAMLVFYERVEEQIKNGSPKFQTGGAAFSEDEWNNLIEKLDSYFEEVREELEARTEEKQKEDEVSSELIEKLLEDRAVSEEEMAKGV